MSDRGKYHGQRLTARQVLNYYAAGERDFRGTILRGCNFRGADLSGADFTGTDIRSTNFKQARLVGNNFSKVLAGSTPTWTQSKLFASILLSALIVCASSIAASSLMEEILIDRSLRDLVIPPGYLLVFLQFLICIIFIARGMTESAVIAIIFSYGATVIFSIGTLSVQQQSLPQEEAAIILASFTGAGTITACFIVLGSYSTTFSFYLNKFSSIGILILSLTILFLRGESIQTFSTYALYIISTYLIASQTLKDFRIFGFRSKMQFPIVFSLNALIGGTSFNGADLTGSSFLYGKLVDSNFTGSKKHPIVLKHVRWHMATGLDKSTFIKYPRVYSQKYINLITSLNGIDKDFSNLNLEEVNLDGANLNRANLSGTYLNNAKLANAELHEVNLTNAQCIGTDFTGAQLTGACLEAWNIDDTTILKDVDCQYVFLKEQADSRGSRERRPHDPDKVFQPGDFEKFFKEMLDTVQILIRQGIHPQVFKETLAKLMADYDLPDDAVQGFEKKGEDVLVTIAVPPDTDKGQFEQDFDELQALKLEAARAQGLLEGERKRADTLEAILLKPGPTTNTVNVNSTAMSNSNNPNISAADGSFVNTGDSLQGNVINLGEISGQVSNQISQLPDAANRPDQPSLKAMLTDIQQAVEAEPELSDPEKKEALGEVGKLAAAGSQPQDNAMQRIAKRAAANLRSITEPLTEASQLATVCQKLLPMILTLF
ncbi:MAG: pentapeptide repeat-containing protein [Leptolyngbyaceae cyanobacterium]